MDYDCCPACSSKRIQRNVEIRGVRFLSRCKKCDAVFGQCYLGDSYQVARPGLQAGDGRIYFDLTCLGSRGLSRRHGWMTADGLVTQIG